MKTQIISAFPGTGKIYFCENTKKKVLDSDSSKFNKSEFPGNYLQHIKSNRGLYEIIFISSHKEIRKSIIGQAIPFTLIYPDISLKEEYLERYKNRNDTKNFITLIDKHWEEWIEELRNEKHCTQIVLHEGEFISDVLK